jgi:hypothetical protein
VSETDLEHVLAQCTETVLEQMFFVRALTGSLPRGGSELVSEVPFEGKPSGRLSLRVTTSAARSIAADFLGEDERVLSEQQVGEVICELANIICGSVLSRVESEATFRLHSPGLVSAATDCPVANSVVHSVSMDNGRLTVAFRSERPVCPTAA